MRLLAWMPRLRRAPLAALWKHLERASPARHGSSDRYARFELSPLEERRVLCAGGVAAPAPALIAGAAIAPTPSGSPATGTIAPTDQTTGALLSNLKTSGTDSIDDIGDTGESSSDDAADGGSNAGAATDGSGASAGSSHAAVGVVLQSDAATASPAIVSPALAGVVTPAASSNFTETSGVLSITVPGSAASEVVNENDVSSPFAGVTIADTAGHMVTVEIDYSASLGTLGPSGGFTSPSSGVSTFTGSVSDANAGIDALHFTPAAGATGLGSTTFTIHVTDSVASVNVTDANTNLQVVAPVLTGNPGTQTVNVGTAFSFPTGVVFSDADVTDTYKATINYGDASVQVTTITPGQSISDIALSNPYGGIGVGTYHLTVSVATAGGVTSNTVSFTVNILPTASNLSYTTTANTSLTGDSLSAGKPAGGLDGSPLIFAVTSGVPSASHGTVTLTNSSTGAFTYAPPMDFSGTDSFTYTITSNGVTSTSATVTITVDPTAAALAYTTTANTTLVESAGTGLATGAVGTSLTYTATDATSGTVSVAGDGSFTYIPNAGFSGTDTFTYTVTDGSGLVSTSATVTITVDPTAAALTYSTTANSTLVESAGTGLATGAAGTSLTFAVMGASNGTVDLTDSSTGAFSFKPTADFSGIATFTYTVSSGIGAGRLTSSVATVTIDVDPTAAALAYTTDANTTLVESAGTGLATGAVGTSLTYTATDATNGTVSVADDGSFTYIPNAGFSGTDTFTYTVTDGSGLVSTSATVTITVDPTAAALTYSTTANTTLVESAGGGLATGAVGTSLTFAVMGASNGTVDLTDSSTGAFSFKPTTDFSGIATFTYTVKDSSRLTSSVATVTIDVDPTATPHSYVTDTNVQLSVSDVDGLLAGAVGSNLTSVLDASPTAGSTLMLASNGSFTYTAGATAIAAGSDTFTFHVASTDIHNNVVDSATETVTITLDPLPTAANVPYSTNENTPLTVDAADGVLAAAAGIPADGAVALTAVLVSGSESTGGSLTLASDGSFTFTPTARFIGNFTFQFKVFDGVTDSVAYTATIAVNGFISGTTQSSINDNTTTAPFSSVTIVDHNPLDHDPVLTATITLSHVNGSTPDGVLTGTGLAMSGSGVNTVYTLTGTSSQVTLDIRSLVFTPTAHLVGHGNTVATTFTITIGDVFLGVLPAIDDSTKVTTTDVNAAPTVAIGAVATSVDEGTAYSLSGVTFTPAYAGDTYTATITWDTGVTTTGTISGGTISGSETYFVYGSHSVSITVTDTNFFSGAPHADVAAFGSNSFTLTVNDVAPAISTTAADLGSQSTNLGTNFTLATAVAFADPGTADPFVATIQWGDGSSSVGVVDGATGAINFSAAAHHFADAGSYNAQITLSDGEQTASPLAFTITVNDVAPTVTAPGGGASVTLNLGSTLTLGFSYAGDGGAESFTYSANFGDGNAVINGALASLTQGVASSASATTGTITFTYAEATQLFGNPGSNTPYTLTITVFDKNAAPLQQTQLQTFTITVLDVAPTLAIGAHPAVDVGASTSPAGITFTSNAFANPASGYIPTYTYSIDWGDGTSSSTSSAAPGEGVTLGGPGVTTNGTIALQHAWPDSSSTGYTVTITVTDDHGGTTVKTYTQVVNNVAPTIVTNPGALTVPEGSTLPIGTIVFADPSFADPALHYTPTFTYTIDWGDGSARSPDLQTGIANVTAAGASGVLTMGALNLSHFYAVTGNYTVTLKVADHHALDSTIETFHVTAMDVPPVIQSLSFTQVSSVNMTTATGTVFDPGAAPLTVVINWADGTTSTIASLPGAAVDNFTVTHTYLFAPDQADPAAPISATVTVSDPYSGMSSETFLIPVSGTGITAVTVQQQPQTTILAMPQTVVAQTPSYVTPTVLNVASAENVVVHTEQTNVIDDQVVLRIVTAIGKEGTSIPMPANVLDDLPGFFKRLPDGHYRVFFLQGDSNRERLLMDVQIRGGRPVDADDDSGTQDRPPSAQLDSSRAFEQWRHVVPAPSVAEQRDGAAVALGQPRSESAISESTLADLIRPGYSIFDEDARATALQVESLTPADASAVFAAPVSPASDAAPRWSEAIESGSTDRQRQNLLVGAGALAGAALLVAEARSRAVSRPAASTAAQRQDASHKSIFGKASRLLKRLRTAHREQTSNSARLDEAASDTSPHASAARIRN